MRAVNLIPAEERRGAGGAGGMSGGAVYVLLGTLALLVVMAGAYAVSGKNLKDKRSELASVTRETEAATAKANALEAYTRFSALRANRVQTVTSLAGSRFDWAHALREVSRVVPSDAWLTTLVGTVAPGVPVDGGTTSAGSLRGALPNPAIEIAGCTTSQKAVARILTRMRLADGVQSVSLADSEKADQAGSAGNGSTGGDCRNGSDRYPQFDLVVFFKPPAAAASPAGQPATGTATTASSTTPAAGQPASAGGSSTSSSPTATSSTSSPQPASGGKTP